MTLTVQYDTVKTATRRFYIRNGETRNFLIGFQRVLDTGELIDSVDDVTIAAHDEDQDADLRDDDDAITVSLDSATLITDSNNAVNTAAETIEEEGETVAIGEGAVFQLTASSATVGVWNRVTITVTTDAANPQTINADILVKVVDR